MDGVALVMACFMVGLSLVFFGVAAIGSYMLYLGYSFRETACSTAVALWAEVHGGTMLAAAIIGLVLVCITLVWSFTHQGASSSAREGGGSGDSSWKDIFWASGIMIPVVLLAIAVFAALVPLLLWGTVILFQDDMWSRMKSSPPGEQPCDPRLYWPAAVYAIAMWIGGYGLLLLLGCCCLCMTLCWCSCCGIEWGSNGSGRGGRGKKGTTSSGSSGSGIGSWRDGVSSSSSSSGYRRVPAAVYGNGSARGTAAASSSSSSSASTDGLRSRSTAGGSSIGSGEQAALVLDHDSVRRTTTGVSLPRDVHDVSDLADHPDTNVIDTASVTDEGLLLRDASGGVAVSVR